jgi:hypothetical protein
MDSFELEIDEQSRIGSEFMARVVNEIRRAVASEKSSRKLTQQAIADKIGTSRAVINRQIQGLENLSSRRVAEILWAIGWEPHFEARRQPDGQNQSFQPPRSASAVDQATRRRAGAMASVLDVPKQTSQTSDAAQKIISSAEDAAYAEPALSEVDAR